MSRSNDAVWSGGVDGGPWFDCKPIAAVQRLRCAIHDDATSRSSPKRHAQVLGIPRASTLVMVARLRKHWRHFKALPAGERFATLHEQQTDAPAWIRGLMIAGAVLALGIAVLLSVLPGPAIVFYAAAAGLIAMQSAWVARTLDRGEVAVRDAIAKRRRRGRADQTRSSY